MAVSYLALAAVALLLTAPSLAPAPAAVEAPGPRVVAIGDVHGAFDQFVEILQTAGIVDAKRQWAGATTILVQTGDIFDRGPKVREALDLLMRLEDEAKRAGGRVESLLGNHEAMNLLHEFRDVSPASYAAFADSKSEARRERAFDDYVRLVKRRATPGEAAPAREAWLASHPPGFLEYVDALGPRGKYGRWLRSHRVVFTESGTAFMHAGVRPDMAVTFDDINRTAIRDITAWDDTKAAMVKAQIVPAFCTLPEAVEAAVAELQRISAALQASAPPGDHVTREFVEQLQTLLAVGKSSLFEPEGPLWFRGFALWPDTQESSDTQVTPVLAKFGVERFVTGHTPSQGGRIVSRFNNRLILIDTGMLSTFFKNGRASALELQNGRITAIYTDSRTPIVAPAAAYVLREAFPTVFVRPGAFPLSFGRVAAADAASAASRY
jgi:Calcineurin-like phosphoesterase